MIDKDRFRDRLSSEYQAGRAKLHESGFWAKWRSMEPFHRVIFVLVFIFALAALFMLVANYWDVLPVYPSGEGG